MSIRGVILAGGKGTRLGELTKVTNKHLLPVGPWPMVYHPLKKLTGAGLQDILLVSGTEHMGDFVELLGSGTRPQLPADLPRAGRGRRHRPGARPGRALLHGQPGLRAPRRQHLPRPARAAAGEGEQPPGLGVDRPEAGARPRPLRRGRVARATRWSASRRSRRTRRATSPWSASTSTRRTCSGSSRR